METLFIPLVIHQRLSVSSTVWSTSFELPAKFTHYMVTTQLSRRQLLAHSLTCNTFLGAEREPSPSLILIAGRLKLSHARPHSITLTSGKCGTKLRKTSETQPRINLPQTFYLSPVKVQRRCGRFLCFIAAQIVRFLRVLLRRLPRVCVGGFVYVYGVCSRSIMFVRDMNWEVLCGPFFQCIWG